MVLSLEATLQKRKREIINDLTELAARDRKPEEAGEYIGTAKFLFDALEETEAALGKRSRPDDMRYVTCPRAIDAIVQCLTEAGRPMSRKAIFDVVLQGFWRGGRMTEKIGERNALNLNSGINIHITGSGRSTRIIKDINDLVGLWEWEDSRFGE